MAYTDAVPVPKKSAAYRLQFGIFKNDGTLITSAAGLDSEIAKDDGSFTDCMNEATEIGSTGIYKLELTSTEMSADIVTVLVKSSTTGAIPVVLTLYPEEAGDIRVNTVQISGNTDSADNLEQSTLGIRYCNAQGSHSNTTTVSDTSTLSAVDDIYIGRTIVFVTGSLLGQATRISDYVGSTKTFTHGPLAGSSSAANGDKFVVV